jgi:DNA-directed RNA polymerase delta subunit
VDIAASDVHPGEFYGLSRPQAATALLRKVGKPLTTTQIFEGLKEASFDVSGKNALNVLYTALKRSGDVRKVAPNTWGLREWYPHLKEPKKRIPVISNAEDVLPLEPREREGR